MTKLRDQMRLLNLYFALVLLFMTCELGSADQNITIEDSDVSTVFYNPSTFWRASTVPCSNCLNPPASDANGGTWHDGTHIVFSTDGDDSGPGGGDTNGTSAAGPNPTSLSNSASGTQNPPSSPPANPPASTPPPAKPPPSSSSSSVPAASPSNGDGDGDGGDGDGDGDGGKGGKQKGKGGNGQRRRDLVRKQDNNSNPFFTSGDDSDDPGFVDPQVTATINFTGSAIYLFAIIPVFLAPPLTNPTIMNLTFTLDEKPHGEFRNNPSSLNSSSPSYIPNFPVFSAEGLGDGKHSIVVTVGPDSVFLFDYALVTQNATDTNSAPNEQRTSSADSSDSTRHHDVSTFVGAIGGSVGFLSLLSLGLCISIKIRRRRFARRERNTAQVVYAEAFTADDHGGNGNGFDDGENLEGGGVSGAPPSRRARRQRAASARPLMAQVGASAPFVPRYFPGSVPASPPPYVAADADRMVIFPDGDALQVTPSGAVTPLPPPPQFSAAVAAPPPMLDFYRTNTGGSYADRPPPTPPPEDEQPIAMFGERGMVTPPPALRTPLAEETDPMLGTRQEEDVETASLRRSVRSMISSSALSSSDVTSSNTGTSNRHTLVSVTSASPLSTPKSLPAGQLPLSNSSPSLISHLTTSSAEQPQASAPEDTSKILMPNLLGGPVSILIGRNDPSSNPSPSRVQSLPHLRHSASHASGPGTGAEDRMSLRSFSIDDHEGVGSSS